MDQSIIDLWSHGMKIKLPLGSGECHLDKQDQEYSIQNIEENWEVMYFIYITNMLLVQSPRKCFG